VAIDPGGMLVMTDDTVHSGSYASAEDNVRVHFFVGLRGLGPHAVLPKDRWGFTQTVALTGQQALMVMEGRVHSKLP